MKKKVDNKKTYDVIQWIVSSFFLLTAIINLHYSSIFFLLAAVLSAPIPAVRNFIYKLFKTKIPNKIAVLLSVLFFIIGAYASPLSKMEPEQTAKEITSFISPSTSSGYTKTESKTTPSTSSKTTSSKQKENEIKEVGSGVSFTLKDIPAYSGSPYVVLNDNIPTFNKNEITSKGYEKYSDLDNLGRTQTALASLGKETMPKANEERKSISHIKPTGWVQAKYDCISGKYLYNRCHLIGWQLSAENDNKKNLITGTKYMNISGMLPFENMVADYIKETNNHIAYRVTPYYENNNLLANGVQIEAYSVEDNGEGICFNVFCYNIQPSIEIDYKTGQSKDNNDNKNNSEVQQTESIPTQSETVSSSQTAPTPTPSQNQTQMVWIPKSGKKYHNNPYCSGMNNPTQVTVEQARNQGYTPCKKCY